MVEAAWLMFVMIALTVTEDSGKRSIGNWYIVSGIANHNSPHRHKWKELDSNRYASVDSRWADMSKHVSVAVRNRSYSLKCY